MICRTRILGALSLIAMVTVSGAARGADDYKLFAEGSLGVGLSAGAHSFSVTFEDRKYFDKATVTGPLVNAAFTVGVAWTNVALGFAVDGTYVRSFWRPRHDDRADATVWAGSAVAILRSAETGVQGALLLGYATGKATGGNDGYLDTVYASTSENWMYGPRLALRVGYMWPSGFGVSTTGSYAYLIAEDSKYLPLTMAVNGFLAGW
jgi:hypothetical protein